MLRALVLLAGGLGLAAGIALLACLADWRPGAWMATTSALLLVGTFAERTVYKPVLRAAPGPDWRATEERFLDPGTGQPVRVYVKPATGRRAYVLDG